MTGLKRWWQERSWCRWEVWVRYEREEFVGLRSEGKVRRRMLQERCVSRHLARFLAEDKRRSLEGNPAVGMLAIHMALSEGIATGYEVRQR